MVAMWQGNGMMSNTPHQCWHRLTGHHGLRDDDAKWTILLIEVIVGRRLVGLVVQVHQQCTGSAARSTESNGKLAIEPA